MSNGQVVRNQIGSYDLIEEIGVGGNAIVYLARDEKLGCQVAIKVLRQNLALDGIGSSVDGAEAMMRRRFWRECKTIGGLDHPNIVRARYSGNEGDLTYLVMDYVPGGNLQDNIETNGPPAKDRLFDWMMQICDGLEYAHSLDIVHRDLKPSNILISENNTAKIVDFGLALVQSDEILDRSTIPGVVVGTPDFMAPEQIANPMESDHRCDIYALGCVFYVMLFGQAPFSGQKTMNRKLAAHQQLKPEWGIPEVSLGFWKQRRLRKLVMSMIAKDPRSRPQSVKVVRQRIENLINKKSTTVSRSPVPGNFNSRALVKQVSLFAGFLVLGAAVAFGVKTGWSSISLPSLIDSKVNDREIEIVQSENVPNPSQVASSFNTSGANSVGSLRSVVIGVKSGKANSQETASAFAAAMRKQESGRKVSVARELNGKDLANAKLPTKANSLNALEEALSGTAAEDRLVCYFSGPIALNRDGHRFLVPDGVDATSIDESEFNAKLLALDTVGSKVENAGLHHGLVVIDGVIVANSSGSAATASKALGRLPVELEVVVSCQTELDGYEWGRRNTGMLTYWLVRGLEGAADANHDENVSAAELTDFAENRTSTYLQLLAEEKQSRRVPLKQLVSPLRVSYAPSDLYVSGFGAAKVGFTQSMDRLSSAMDDYVQLGLIQKGEKKTVAVSEFINDGSTKGSDPGILSSLGSQLLARMLTVDAHGGYHVQTPDQVAELLNGKTKSEIVSPATWHGSETDFLVDTHFVSDTAQNELRVTSCLIDVRSGKKVGEATSRIARTPELVSILNGSRQIEYLGPIDHQGTSNPVWTHPFANDYRNANVELAVQVGTRMTPNYVQFRNTQPELSADDPSIAEFKVNKGDELKFVLRNRTSETLATLVYVDGINIFDHVKGMPPREAIAKRKYFFLEPHKSQAFDRWFKQKTTSVGKRVMDTNTFKVATMTGDMSPNEYGTNYGEIRILTYKVMPYTKVMGGKGIGSTPFIDRGKAGTSTLRTINYLADPAQPLEVTVLRYSAYSN